MRKVPLIGLGSVLVLATTLALVACGSDAAPPPAGSGDASADADVDGADPSDGGPRDAQPDAPPGVFCEGLKVDFCGEFAGATPGAGWDGVDARGGGAVDLVAATETSKPSALRSKLPQIASGANAANAQVAKKLAIAGNKRIIVSLSANIGAAAPAAGGSVTYFYALVDGGGIALLRRDTGWFVRVSRKNTAGDDGVELPLTSAPPLSKWTRIDLEILLANPGGALKLTIDGAQVVTQALATHGDGQPLTDATLAVGLTHDTGPIPAMEASFDDATFDLEP